MEEARKELEEWKARYAEFMPTSVLEEKNQLEEDLEHATQSLVDRTKELDDWKT